MLERDEIERQVSCLLPRGYEPLLLEFGLDSARHPAEGTDIGTDYGTRFVVLGHNGFVISQSEAGEYPVRFVNSSIAALAGCIRAHEHLLGTLSEEPSEAELQAAILQFRDQISAADSLALRNPENWWTIVIEQLEYELP